jgi:hypothetical protein
MMTMMNILNVNLHGQRRRGLQIGDYLVILPYPYGHPTQRKIYNLCAKKPIHNTVLSHNLAVEIAKNYEKPIVIISVSGKNILTWLFTTLYNTPSHMGNS